MNAIPPDRLAEAGVWIARLHGDERSRALESGFRQWLRAHPMNARAFELSTEVWEDSQNLRRVVPFAHELAPVQKSPSRFTLPALATMAAAVALLIIGAVFFLQHAGVATDVGEQRLLTLEDGSRVYLNTDTRVVQHYDKKTRRVELEHGEALFDVAKRSDRPFIVTAGDRQVRALGTSFVVRRDEQQLAVTLVEGAVTVSPVASSSSSAQPVVLAPGQRITFALSKPAKLDTPLLDKTTAWRRGQVVLDDTPLSNAVAEMNRYSTVKLTIERPEAANLPVNGLFQAGDSASFATAVAQAYGLEVVERHEEILLSGIPKSVDRPQP